MSEMNLNSTVIPDITVILRTQGCAESIKDQAADEIEKLRFCLRDALEIGYGAICNWPTISRETLGIENDDDA